MESPNLSGCSDSDLSLPPEQRRIEESNPHFSTRSTWKSRCDCIQAYFCFLMSFANGLHFGASIGRYGFLIFIPYAICNIFIGVPAVLVEVTMGRYVMGNTAKAWNMCPLTKGILWNLLVTTIISITNNFIYAAYLLEYFFLSFTDQLKWSTCEARWNYINCYKVGKKTSAMNNCLKNNSETFCRSLKWESSGTQFWKYEIADKTSVTANVSYILNLLTSVCIVTIINVKGIRSLERIILGITDRGITTDGPSVKITENMFILLVSFPIFLGIILACVAFSTPEALIGLKEICTFNWHWLRYPEIWTEALENTLLFLGLGDLSVTLISSHGEFTDDIFLDVVIIIFGGFIFCLFIMIPILSVSVGSRGKQSVSEKFHLKLFKDKEDVFISISDALTVYPFPNTLWSAMTYLYYFLIASSAQAVLVLAVCDILVAMINFDSFYTMIIFLVFSLVISICLMYCNFEFLMEPGLVVLTVIVLFTITWQLFYGVHNFNYDFFFMMGCPLPFYLKCSWLTLVTGTLTVWILKLFLGKPDEPFKFICYVYAGIPCVIYIIGFIFEIAVFQYKKEKISHVFFPNPNWTSENPLLNKSRLILASGNVNREFMYRQELNKKPFKKPADFTEQNIVQLI